MTEAIFQFLIILGVNERWHQTFPSNITAQGWKFLWIGIKFSSLRCYDTTYNPFRIAIAMTPTANLTQPKQFSSPLFHWQWKVLPRLTSDPSRTLRTTCWLKLSDRPRLRELFADSQDRLLLLDRTKRYTRWRGLKKILCSSCLG